MTQYRDYKPEVIDLVAHLHAAGFTVVEADDGGESHTADLTPERVTEIVTSVDESRIYVTNPNVKRSDGKSPRTLGLFIVLGNEPGVLVCDYHCCDELEAAVTAHADKWEGTEQRMRAD